MRGINLTPDQIESLVQAYKGGGLAGSEGLCKQYGVNRKYPYILAAERGLKYDYGYTKAQSRQTKKQEDVRWQWAIERGPVIA